MKAGRSLSQLQRASPVASSQAAKSAGARCLGLTTSFSAEQLRAPGADWTAANLEEAPFGVLDW